METLLPKTDPAVIQQLSEMGINLLSPQKGIAARIRDNNHLAEFIQAIAPANRLNFYNGLVEHLNFIAKPYWWLMARRRKKNASKKR